MSKIFRCLFSVPHLHYLFALIPVGGTFFIPSTCFDSASITPIQPNKMAQLIVADFSKILGKNSFSNKQISGQKIAKT